MTNCPEYAPMEIVAYRAEREDGWRVGETQTSAEIFRAGLEAQGIPIAEVRSVVRGSRRIGLKDDDAFLGSVGYYAIITRGWTWDDSAACWRAPEEMILTLPGPPAIVEDVKVEFGPADSGWQPVRIIAGGITAAFEGLSRAVLKFARQASRSEQATRPWRAVQDRG